VKPSQQELTALKNLLSQANHILETTPVLPESRTAACRELLGLSDHFKTGQPLSLQNRPTTDTVQDGFLLFRCPEGISYSGLKALEQAIISPL
jgi:hypothetical protein